ncbi:alpha/beta hydrolase [Demequina sp.]|uniref:alpha/beta hydrolase n=1 Tax=Demequina sp. TaxID=2050685 RepID=UPI003D118CEA
MTKPRVVVALAAASALALLVLTACTPEKTQVTPEPGDTTAAPTTGGFDAYAQQLNWETCGSVQCADVLVPLDWSNPSGESITVKINKSEATGDKKGSLLINPGGPGGPGLDFAESFVGSAGEDLLAAYDIIGFDPRGVGTSTPVDCGDADTVNEFIVTDWPLETQDDVDAANQRNTDFGNGCEAKTGALIQNVDTASVARDMDVIRALVGDEKLNYLGFSYGTQLGATYAELFPDHVGQMTLDGAVDFLLPTEEQSAGQAEGFERALTNFVNWCHKESNCPLVAGVDAAKKQIHDIAVDAIAHPVPTTTGGEVNGNLMVYGIVVTLYDEGSWVYLQQALDEVIEQDTAFIMGQLADFYLDRDSTTGEYLSNSTVAFSAISCLDEAEEPLWDLAKVDQFRAQMEAASPTFGWWFAGSTGCSGWPFHAKEIVTSLDNATSVQPILVIGTTNDPATPYAWAQSLTAQLGNATLLTYEGEGHTAYGRSNQCIIDAVDGWLVDGTMPDSGTVC